MTSNRQSIFTITLVIIASLGLHTRPALSGSGCQPNPVTGEPPCPAGMECSIHPVTGNNVCAFITPPDPGPCDGQACADSVAPVRSGFQLPVIPALKPAIAATPVTRTFFLTVGDDFAVPVHPLVLHRTDSDGLRYQPLLVLGADDYHDRAWLGRVTAADSGAGHRPVINALAALSAGQRYTVSVSQMAGMLSVDVWDQQLRPVAAASMLLPGRTADAAAAFTIVATRAPGIDLELIDDGITD